MDEKTAHALNEMNNRFYRENHESFSRSRQSPWPGWERLVRSVEPRGDACRVLDIACGNMRFERFLEKRCGETRFEFTCVDSCPLLVPPGFPGRFMQHDVLRALIGGRQGGMGLGRSSYDLAVAFGFMHHVPGGDMRIRFLRELVGSLGEWGVAAVSLWRFASVPGLEKKARESTRRACEESGLSLDAGDYILGWDGDERAYRYCHSFDDGEIDALREAVSGSAALIDRFRSDGRTRDMNEYLVFLRR